MTDIVHDTFTIGHVYRANPERVFHALSDTGSRMRWGAPSADEALVFDNTDFRVGGLEISRCGPKDNLMFRVETRYLAIAPQEHVVFSESVSGPEGPLSASLLTFALSPDGAGTKLTVTGQIASFVGDGMIRGNRNGLAAALQNLQRELQQNR